MKEFSIDLSTGNRFWTPKGLGAMGMDPHRAIAELVANSLDWRRLQEDNVQTVITVKIGKNLIEITDNGVGMTAPELTNAIQLSVSNNEIRKNLRVRKGMFGMGMKVACLSLGWHIVFTAKSLEDSSIENIFDFNSHLLDDNEKENQYRKQLKGQTIPSNANSPLAAFASGTDIKITDLTHKSLNAFDIKDSLQEIFNPEIGVEGVIINVIDVEKNITLQCQQINIPVFEASKIILDDLDLFVTPEDSDTPVQIRGWVGLLKTSGSGSGDWGLHLFKNNQIIERFHQLPGRLGGLMPKNPHPMYARTFGEIHLDMCKPAFHKVGFDYSNDSWIKVRDLLEPHLDIVMNASKDYKKKDFEKAEQSIRSIQQHSRAAKRAIAILSNKPEEIKEEEIKEQDSSLVPPLPSNVINTSTSTNINTTPLEEIPQEVVPNDAIALRDGQWFTIVEPIFDNLGDAQRNKPWIYHFKKESRELAIIINKGSPVYQNLVKNNLNDREVQIVVNWSISDCLLFLLYDKFYYSLPDSSNFRDEQLSKLFMAEA